MQVLAQQNRMMYDKLVEKKGIVYVSGEKKNFTSFKSIDLVPWDEHVIDLIIDEPIGGAHRNHEKTYQNVKKYFLDELKGLSHHSIEDLTRERYKKFADIGV